MNLLFQDHEREKKLLVRLIVFATEQIHAARITENVFSHQLYRQIFGIVKQMHEKKYVITANTICDQIRLSAKFPNGIQLCETIMEIVREDYENVKKEDGAPDLTASEHIPYLVEIMGKRHVSNLSRRMALMLDTHDMESIVSYVDREMGSFDQGYEVRTISNITDTVRENIAKARLEGAPIVKTGFSHIDDAIGFMPSTHCLIIGKSGEGKSALANQLVTNIFLENSNIAVLYFSMEIQEDKLVENFIANLSNTTKNRMRGKGSVPISDTEMDAIDEQIAVINTFDIEIHCGAKDAQEASSIIDVFATGRRGKQLVIVTDHHLYIKNNGRNIQDAINEFSKMYIHKKEQYQALTFLLCQFHMKHTESENNRGEQIPPDAKWIMYPGSLYQDADVTCAIWRRNNTGAYETEEEVLELYWQKNREGQPDICTPLVFTPKYGQFRDVMPQTYHHNANLNGKHGDGEYGNLKHGNLHLAMPEVDF